MSGRQGSGPSNPLLCGATLEQPFYEKSMDTWRVKNLQLQPVSESSTAASVPLGRRFKRLETPASVGSEKHVIVRVSGET
jgi:hypothetical protein